MIASLQCVVLDCSDALELAQFYQSLLGGMINQPDPRWSLGEDWSTLHTGSGLVLCFQRVADHQPPRWPDLLARSNSTLTWESRISARPRSKSSSSGQRR